ncbi:MAG: hypothetical protein IKU07_07075 [Oscillospiraceae bacterium]|nr:hypothetical protein [Oscillospiraceae bacterium]
MVYSMPVTRTGLFLTQFLTGSLFSLALLPVYKFIGGWMHPFWENLFSVYFLFYGLTTLGIMLSGNAIGAMLITFTLASLPMAVNWLFCNLFRPYLPSIAVGDEAARTLRSLFLNLGNYVASYSTEIWIAAGITSLFAFGLFLLRKAEKTGEFTVFAFLRYTFCCAAALIAATLVFQLLEQNVKTDFWFLFLYVPIFYFAFAMVADKRFLVFNQKHLLTVCIFAALLFNGFWVVRLDAFGILTYVPDPKSIQYAELYKEKYSSGVKYNPDYFNNMQVTVRGAENLTLLTEVHESLLDNRSFAAKDSDMVYITYTMKSGVKIRRYYPTYDNRSIYKKLQTATSNNVSIFGYDDWETFRERVFYIQVDRDSSLGRSYYFTDDETLEIPGGDVKILGPRLRNHMLKMLMRDADHGDLTQLDYVNYNVTIKYYDDRGKEQTKKLIIPHTITGSESFLEVCWDSVRGQADRTITDSTPLYRTDISFSADGSGTSHTYPYYIVD